MDDEKKSRPDIIDEDLYEELEEEEVYELIQQARNEALQKEIEEVEQKKPKRPFPKWMFWLIAICLFINVIAILPSTFSIPAIEFLATSARLSVQEDIKTYKEAVVVIETEDSKGTGFGISRDGYILTNYHVIDDANQIRIAYPKDGLFQATIVDVYPDVDLALLKTETNKELPYLALANKTEFSGNDPISFIGNPLAFNGIANEGTIIGYTELNKWDKPVVMIDAPVYHGNSGSPIINQQGKVIGVIFATLDDEEKGKVGLFIPIDYFYESNENNRTYD